MRINRCLIRYKLRATIVEERQHHLTSLQKEISTRREKLRAHIKKWCYDQRVLMPKARDAVALQPSCEVEHEKLFLPSDFQCGVRETIEATALGVEEAKLREGEAFDALCVIQMAVKTMTALQDQKHKNARGQAENTKSGNYIREAQGRRDHHMERYTSACRALISLGMLGNDDPQSPFPPLELEDTFMKSRQCGHGLGNSHRIDGKLWHIHGQAAGTSETPPLDGVPTVGQRSDGTDTEQLPFNGTHMSRRNKVVRNMKTTTKQGPKDVAVPKAKEEKEGWLWHIAGRGKMLEKEMEEWEAEGDRVQWFRAEGEMQRWQEQIEQKLAEFLRCMRSFTKMKEVWADLSLLRPTHLPGHIAYAKQKADMYARMEEDCKKKFDEAGYKHLRTNDGVLVNYVAAKCVEELASCTKSLEVDQ